MLLPDHLIEGSWPHPYGERRIGIVGWIGSVPGVVRIVLADLEQR